MQISLFVAIAAAVLIPNGSAKLSLKETELDSIAAKLLTLLSRLSEEHENAVPTGDGDIKVGSGSNVQCNVTQGGYVGGAVKGTNIQGGYIGGVAQESNTQGGYIDGDAQEVNTQGENIGGDELETNTQIGLSEGDRSLWWWYLRPSSNTQGGSVGGSVHGSNTLGGYVGGNVQGSNTQGGYVGGNVDRSLRSWYPSGSSNTQGGSVGGSVYGSNTQGGYVGGNVQGSMSQGGYVGDCEGLEGTFGKTKG